MNPSTSQAATKGLPDMRYIRERIAIEDVARALGIRIVTRNKAHCWREQNHRHGDRTPSLSFHKNKAKCFVCDGAQLSTIDFVCAYCGCTPVEAARWIAERWQVPTIAAKKQKSDAALPPMPIPLWLSDCGYIATLDRADVTILMALFARSQGDTVEVGYRTLARRAGIKSFETIRRVLLRFQTDGLLRQDSNPKSRKRGFYTFTLTSNRFQALRAQLEQAMYKEMEHERESHAARVGTGNWKTRRGQNKTGPSFSNTATRKPPVSISAVPSKQILTSNQIPPHSYLPKSGTVSSPLEQQTNHCSSGLEQQAQKKKVKVLRRTPLFDCQEHGPECVNEGGYPRCWDEGGVEFSQNYNREAM